MFTFSEFVDQVLFPCSSTMDKRATWLNRFFCLFCVRLLPCLICSVLLDTAYVKNTLGVYSPRSGVPSRFCLKCTTALLVESQAFSIMPAGLLQLPQRSGNTAQPCLVEIAGKTPNTVFQCWVKLSHRIHILWYPSVNSFKFQPCDHTPPGTQTLWFLLRF